MMEIGSIIDILRTHPETIPLKPGDLLKVNVLEVFENQRALVDLGRFRAMADIVFPVAAGDELWVRVMDTQNQLRLQLVPAPAGSGPSAEKPAGPVQAGSAESFEQIRVSIDQLAAAEPQVSGSQRLPAEPKQILDALRIFLAPFELASGPDAIARKLKEFCDASGLFLEIRLAEAMKRTSDGAGGVPVPATAPPEHPGRVLSSDLKARVMLLTDFFGSSAGRQLIADSREVAGLARAAAEILADVRAGQEQMAKAAPASEPFQMIHFALPMPDDRHQAQLKIAYRRGRDAATRNGRRAAILLRLDRVGAVRADLLLMGRSLNISIFVSAPEIRDLATRHAAEVREALAAFFESVVVHVSVSTRKIAQFVAEDWRPFGESQVDVRV